MGSKFFYGGLVMSDKLYIVIPAYNEADNIKNVLEDWYNYVRGGGV